MAEARGRGDGDPAREELLSAISAVPIDLRGVVLSYKPDKNQGSNHLFFTIMQADGSFEPVVCQIKLAGL